MRAILRGASTTSRRSAAGAVVQVAPATRVSDGDRLRDFILSRCRAGDDWLDRDIVVSGLFMFGTGTARSFKDMNAGRLWCTRARPNILYIDMPTIRGAHPYFTQSEVDRHARALQWRLHALEDAVGIY